MKLFYTAVLALLFHFTSNATTWNVAVSNFQFSPNNFNALIGDVVIFTWQAGSFSHTTTCGSAQVGTSLPAGAAEWNSPMTAANPTFTYNITTAGTYNYGCIPHFEFMTASFTVSGPLPVIFENFSVANNKSNALLQWQTASESNTDFFSIRKSTDGTHFTEIGRQNAAGNSNLKLSYQFSDNDLGKTNKYLYYEIVIVDKDRKETFSAIKTFRNNTLVNDNLIVALSPNPITRPGQVQLKFNADEDGEMDVAVYNGTGQMVLKTKMAAFYGLNSGHLHVCDLEKGIYNIVFTLAGKKEVKKIVVL